VLAIINSERIAKLRQINEKLQKELKVLSGTLNKSSEKSKLRQKASTNENIKAKERELDVVQKQMQGYQKEIGSLKDKLAAKTGYDKIIDIENTLKDGDMKTQELLKQEKMLKDILKTQERELGKLKKDFGFTEKLKSLSEELKQYKEANRELEKKIQAENQSYQKCHTKFMDLQSKMQRLKEEKLRWKKAVADKLPAPPNEVIEESKRSEEEILQESLTLLQKRLKTEKAISTKNLRAVRMEIEEHERRLKEAEQEAKLNTDKLSQLRRVLRFRQLNPLDEGERNRTTINVQKEVKGDFILKVRTNKSIKNIRRSQKLLEETSQAEHSIKHEDTNENVRDLDKDDNKNKELNDDKEIEAENAECKKTENESAKDEKIEDENIKGEKIEDDKVEDKKVELVKDEKFNEELKEEKDQMIDKEVKKEEENLKVEGSSMNDKEVFKVYNKKEEMELPDEIPNKNKENTNEEQRVEQAKVENTESNKEEEMLDDLLGEKLAE
jgi:hypothetical protein